MDNADESYFKVEFDVTGKLTGSFAGLLSSKGTADKKATIGVREVIYDLDGNVVAKSALKKVNVKW